MNSVALKRVIHSAAFHNSHRLYYHHQHFKRDIRISCCKGDSRLENQSVIKKKYKLRAVEINPSNFKSFGQVISWRDDGEKFSSEDLQVELTKGIPRYYIFRKRERTLNFHAITFHENVTQCLSSVQDAPWYIVVSAANFNIKKPPFFEELLAFKVKGGTILKLNLGTWHAGPFFQDLEFMDFFTLELCDTNIEDHNTHVYSSENISFEIID